MVAEQEKPLPETLKEIYELVKGSLDRQADEGQMLDSKMVQIFSASSIVAGLAGFSVSGGADIDGASATLLTLAFAAYAGVAYTGFRHLKPRTYHLLNYPDIWRKSCRDEPEELHHSVIAKVTENHELNELILDDKAKLLHWVTIAAGAEVLFVGLAVTSVLFG